MLRLKKDKFTPEEYLAMEVVAEYKSEFFGCEIPLRRVYHKVSWLD